MTFSTLDGLPISRNASVSGPTVSYPRSSATVTMPTGPGPTVSHPRLPPGSATVYRSSDNFSQGPTVSHPRSDYPSMLDDLLNGPPQGPTVSHPRLNGPATMPRIPPPPQGPTRRPFQDGTVIGSSRGVSDELGLGGKSRRRRGKKAKRSRKTMRSRKAMRARRR